MTLVHRNDKVTEPTLNASVFRQIRADIVACRLAPNERLRVETLRERYGIGGSPIREALMRLEAEGLVVLEQNKGFRVSSVSREQLDDLTAIRVEIETTALRWSIEKGGVEWEANLLAAFHRLSRLKKIDQGSGASWAWFAEHRHFHSALVAACGSPLLIDIREGLFDQAERYVALSITSRFPTRNDVGEHEQIMRAALSRSVTRALQLNRSHIERTSERVAKSLTDGSRALRLHASNDRNDT